MSQTTKLQHMCPHTNFKQNEILAPLTTVKIGGPAEIFCETHTTKELIQVITSARKLSIPITMLGWGSNTLISDKGIQGLVIKNKSNDIVIDTNKQISDQLKREETHAPRLQSDTTQGTFKYHFDDLEYDESNLPQIKVTLDAGTPLPYAINYLLNKGISGLQWYAGIPGTIGGAIYNNIHGGTHFISEILLSVKVLTENNIVQTIDIIDLETGYDTSRFHTTNEIILSGDFALYLGNIEQAKHVAITWAKRKKISQPHNSLGCVFQNISNKQMENLGYPTTSVGYIIEHILNLKGFSIGDAKISEQHCSFIENTKNATAKDYLELIRFIKNKAEQKIGIRLKPEIFFLGFSDEELRGVI